MGVLAASLLLCCSMLASRSHGTATCRPLHHPLCVLPHASGASQANFLMAGPAFLNAYKCQKDVLLLAVPTFSPCRSPSSSSAQLSWGLSSRQVAGTAGSMPGLSTLSSFKRCFQDSPCGGLGCVCCELGFCICSQCCGGAGQGSAGWGAPLEAC